MLQRVLLIFGSIWFARYSVRQLIKIRRRKDRISALPDDLLLKILSFLPTQEAVATTILSERWRFVWRMLPKLEYIDSDYKQHLEKVEKSIWGFLDESLELHNAIILERLVIELGPLCPVDADVRKWISYAVDRMVRDLHLKLSWLSEPTILPNSLYLCKRLVNLALSNKIIVDVPAACLPSLKTLCLVSVVYKDEDSLVRLLSGCHILDTLYVERHDQDKLTNFNVEVPSLKTLMYIYDHDQELGEDNQEGSLVIDSIALRKLFIKDSSGNFCSIENRPRLDKAIIDLYFYPDDKFMTSLSSVTNLTLHLNVFTVACCKDINFSHLTKCKLFAFQLDWSESFMCLLQNSPKLKVLQIALSDEDFSVSFNRPSSVPECLSSHLEILELNEYGGRNEEKEVVRYILANSKCLERVGIAFKPASSRGDRKRMRKELKSMDRVSASSQLLFFTQFKSLLYVDDEDQWSD